MLLKDTSTSIVTDKVDVAASKIVGNICYFSGSFAVEVKLAKTSIFIIESLSTASMVYQDVKMFVFVL